METRRKSIVCKVRRPHEDTFVTRYLGINCYSLATNSPWNVNRQLALVELIRWRENDVSGGCHSNRNSSSSSIGYRSVLQQQANDSKSSEKLTHLCPSLSLISKRWPIRAGHGSSHSAAAAATTTAASQVLFNEHSGVASAIYLSLSNTFQTRKRIKLMSMWSASTHC